MAAKVLVCITLLLATTMAEPPVGLGYLPPTTRKSLSNQYGPPEIHGFADASNEFKSSSYLPPFNNLQEDSYNSNGNFVSNGLAKQISTTFDSQSQEQNSKFPSDSITIDSASNIDSTFAFRRPSTAYGAPNGFDRSAQRTTQGSSGFGVLSPITDALRPTSRYSNTGSSPKKLSNTYGVPFQSAQSGFGSSATEIGRVSARYGPPVKSTVGSNNQEFRPSSLSTVPVNQASDSFISAIPSNSYGIPFKTASANNLNAEVHGIYGTSSNENARQLRNQFMEYPDKASIDDHLAETAKYEYNYEVQATAEHGTNFGHKENRENELAKGVYHVLLPDGRMQIVEYEADERGYRPQVRYEETGYLDARSGHNGY